MNQRQESLRKKVLILKHSAIRPVHFLELSLEIIDGKLDFFKRLAVKATHENGWKDMAFYSAVGQYRLIKKTLRGLKLHSFFWHLFFYTSKYARLKLCVM